MREGNLQITVDKDPCFHFQSRDPKTYIVRPMVEGEGKIRDDLLETVEKGERQIIRFMREKYGRRSLGVHNLMVCINSVDGVYKVENKVEIVGGKSSLYWWERGLKRRMVSFALGEGKWERTSEVTHHEAKILRYEEEAISRYSEDLKSMSSEKAFKEWYGDSYV